MPDIAMCSGVGCPLKDTCYRASAKPEMLQSYFANPPVKDGKCEYYWPTVEVVTPPRSGRPKVTDTTLSLTHGPTSGLSVSMNANKMKTYTNAAAAVARSITSNESTQLQTDETYSGLANRMQIALDALEELGMINYAEESSRLYDCYGEDEAGNEWRVKVVDLLEA